MFIKRESVLNYKLKKTTLKLSRAEVVLARYVGLQVVVHNGEFGATFEVQKKHVGFKAGEFVFTRIRPVHKSKKKKK
jgi:ribosomal protein S19